MKIYILQYIVLKGAENTKPALSKPKAFRGFKDCVREAFLLVRATIKSLDDYETQELQGLFETALGSKKFGIQDETKIVEEFGDDLDEHWKWEFCQWFFDSYLSSDDCEAFIEITECRVY